MIIAPSQLAAELKSPNPPILIDVLTPESFAAEHIPGAVNHCVYEIAFLENVREIVISPNTNLVVYGLEGQTLEAETAATKLKEAGYSQVRILEGGLKGWSKAGLSTDGTGKMDDQGTTGRFPVDAATSVIFWTGQNLFNHHTGTLRLQDGFIELRNSALTSAEFTIDMNSIACSDIENLAMNTVLVNHLKHSDFFETSKFPTATFRILKAEPISGSIDGSPNFDLAGELTLKGHTKPVAFPAVIARRPDGGFTAQAHLTFDRTEFGVIYGSGRFFSRLGQHLVNDHIHLHLKILTKPESENRKPERAAG